MQHEHRETEPAHPAIAAFSPKQTFLLGLGGGVLVICTIGFFILLGVMFGGDEYDDDYERDGAPTVVVDQPSAPAAPAAPELRAVDEDDNVKGAENPKVTIVEFSDLECPFCARFHPTMEKILENYGDDVRWVWRHFPLESIHPKARSLAIATECAAEQGKFWEMTDEIIKDTGKGTLENYASAAGVNFSKLQKCVDSGKYDSAVTEDAKDAVAAGGQGTPYSVIVGPAI